MSETGDAEVSEDIGTKLLFENDHVRVWDLRLAPGERTGYHRHTNDYLYVVIGGGKLKALHADGREWYDVEMGDGEVRYRTVEAADVHDAENVGDDEWRNVIVEFKR